MNTVRYIIIEDEAYAMQHLRQLVESLRPHWQCVFQAESIAEAHGYFASGHNPDLCFMDIELSDGNIFELFRNVKVDSPVIFTTAYDNYSLNAFSTNAVGYVLKPIAPDELGEAIEKYERSWGRHQSVAKMLDTMMEAVGKQAQAAPTCKRILTAVGDKYGYVNLSDIAWLISEDKYVYVVNNEGERSLTTLTSLNEAEEILDGHDFFRISRGIICSIHSVRAIHRYFKGRLKVELAAGNLSVEDTVSAARKTEFLNWIGSGSDR